MSKRSDRYVAHAERFGVELVFETAVGLGETEPELTAIELVQLARRLKAIDPRFDATRPDKLIELAGAGHMRVPDDFPSTDPDKRHAYQREQARRRHLDRLALVLDAIATPAPTSADRCCEWCGKAIAGHSQRRTCSVAHRKALQRSGGIGPFSGLKVGQLAEPDLRVGPGRNVTLLARKQRGFQPENRGVGSFREVAIGRS